MKVDWKSIEIEWDESKSRKIKSERGYSFEELARFIKNGNVIDFIEHHNKREYPNQWFIVVNVNGYPWAVASEFRKNKLRLITAFPARKHKKYFREEKDGI
ncbi:MAG: BrnT family toxin [Desulfurobacterium sp.]|nr:MAG: BrnT family toxin [Desulfurobacterium sp.]